MSSGSPYDMQAPSRWALPPKRFSFSSLQSVTSCPRRWQLLHSEWGSFSRFPEREHPAAMEGKIVHEALDMLSRALGRRGRPAVGSPEFQAAAAECGFWEFFSEKVVEWNARAAEHPRAGPGLVIRTAPRELANRAVRLLRERYRPGLGRAAQARGGPAPTGSSFGDALIREGMLSEVKLEHPSLLLMGILDLVLLDADGGSAIVDFKTGAAKDAHRDQLRLYAVLLWRHMGRVPASIAIQYLDESWEEVVSETALAREEERVAAAIDAALAALAKQPGPAIVSQECARCPVRARCDEGWSRAESNRDLSGRTADLELTIVSTPTPTGFTGRRRDGSELPVVYEAAVGGTLPRTTEGARVRLTDVVPTKDSKAVEIRPWSEIFVL